MQLINSPFLVISKQSGIPLDIVKMLSILIINIPLSGLFTIINSSSSRLLYSLIVGLIEIVFLLEFESSYVIGASVLIYATCIISKKHAFMSSVILSSLILTIVHLHRFLFDYNSWKIDCSVYMMYLVSKMTYYGFWVHSQQKQNSSTALEYFSYCFYFPSLCVGPTFAFDKFQDYIHLKNQYSRIKTSFVNVITPLGLGIVFAAITAVAMPIFTPQWILYSPTMQSLTVFEKLMALNVIGVFLRIKFYTAWYLVQATINISGLSYSENGKNDSVITGSVMFELEPNPKKKTEFWNSSIQTWLKVVVYDNLLKINKSQTIAVFLTFFISAFWHGVYLSYYFGFLQWAIMINLTKWVYKMSFVLPQKFRNSIVSTILTYFVGLTSFTYIAMGMVMLDWSLMTELFNSLYWSITIIIFTVFFLSNFIRPPKQLKKQIPEQGKDNSSKASKKD